MLQRVPVPLHPPYGQLALAHVGGGHARGRDRLRLRRPFQVSGPLKIHRKMILRTSKSESFSQLLPVCYEIFVIIAAFSKNKLIFPIFFTTT
jgi:hypothetical protein